METFSSVLKVEYDIQLIYESLKEYKCTVPKYKIREVYFKQNEKVNSVIIHFLIDFLENKSNLLTDE
jgi:hypothetical protein